MINRFHSRYLFFTLARLRNDEFLDMLSELRFKLKLKGIFDELWGKFFHYSMRFHSSSIFIKFWTLLLNLTNSSHSFWNDCKNANELVIFSHQLLLIRLIMMFCVPRMRLFEKYWRGNFFSLFLFPSLNLILLTLTSHTKWASKFVEKMKIRGNKIMIIIFVVLILLFFTFISSAAWWFSCGAKRYSSGSRWNGAFGMWASGKCYLWWEIAEKIYLFLTF